MLLHYLKIAWRNIWNDKLYSLINLIGLTVAFTVVFLFVQWIRYELSFETCYPDSDRIYQVQEAEKRDDGIHKNMYMRPAIDTELQEKYPIIEEAMFITSYRGSIELNGNAFSYNRSNASLNFFKLFPMELVAGTMGNADNNNSGVFISEKFAEKVFGNPKKAAGKEFIFFREQRKVDGVIRVPENSVIQFDLLFLRDVIRDRGTHFIKIKDNASFNENQQRLMANFLTERDGNKNKLIFKPLKKIHLYTDSNTEKFLINQGNYYGSIKEINTFIVVVSLLLLLAIINYVNTSTARSLSRAKEVGVRKISGSNRRQLIIRFLTEAFIISFVAVFLAMDIAKMLHHSFEHVMSNTFDFKINGFTFLLGIGMCFITTLLAGGYAAFYLSSLNPVNVLAGDIGRTGSKNIFRKILLGIQFIIAISILISTWTVFRQLNYMLNKDLGFDKDGVYIFNTNLFYDSERFIDELQKNPYIKNATMAFGAPYNVQWAYSGVNWQNATQGTQEITFAELTCDHRYDDVFELQMVQGNFIPPRLSWWQFSDNKSYSIVINETFKKLIGVENPVGMTIVYGGEWKVEGKIIGVVKDFYFRPLNYKISPLIIRFNPEYMNTMYIKIDPNHEKEAISHIRSIYEKTKEEGKWLGTIPFQLIPLEKEYREMYKSETRLQRILNIFSLLSIILSFMGIISMVAFIIEKRTKEIGIRKINGAKWLDIVREFWKEFLLLVAIAAVPAMLVSYWLMHNWLQQYMYHPAFAWWIFVLVPLFIVALTILILYLQVQSIARKNPVECLKSE